jgi:polysaccharide biosynthesis transport protein
VNSGPHSITVSNARGHDSDTAPTEIPLSSSESGSSSPGMNLNDILFILFRHKWKIIVCAASGILAAASLYFLLPSQYESQAKLFVRYVVDRSAVDGVDTQNKSQTIGSPSESAINSEVEILTSTDLAMQVAATVGADRLLPGSGEKATNAEAALAILKGLEVTVVKDSSIISVIYKNKDPKLAIQVLQELVTRYFDKHLAIHRSLGGVDFLTQESNQLRAQLDQTEQELKQLKAKAGITSLAEDTAALATDLAKAQSALDASEGDLAAQKARITEIEKALAG